MCSSTLLLVLASLMAGHALANSKQLENPSQLSDRVFVTCGKIIQERADAFPKVGECAHNATTGDPRVFGPDAWRTWHRFAHNYPIHPNPKTEKACVNWIRALPYMLPCTLCGLDFLDFITKNELFAGTYEYDECAASLEFDMPCQPPEVACTTRSYLINFFLRAHHNVDRHTKPCKKLWSPQEAAITYGNEFLCASCVVWGKCGKVGLCRSEDQANCTSTPECPSTNNKRGIAQSADQ